MEKQPKVSVLLPVRDGGRPLRSALRSLERQTFEDFEIVVVNDGSSDGTADLLERWQHRDARLRVLSLEPSGLVPALNRGLDACRGELIARMDADDAMLPLRLERQVQLLDTRSEIDVAGCQVRCFPRRQLGQGFRIYEDWLNSLVSPADHRRERFIESPIAHPTAMVRRDALEAAGGYHDADWAEDYDLWLRLLEKGHRIEKVPEILHLWRDHPGRQTRVDGRYSKKKFLACKAHYLSRHLRETGVSRLIIWGAGPTGRALASLLRTHGHTIDAFLDIDPKKLRRRPGGTPVHDVADLPSLWQAGSRLLVAVSRRGARELIRPHVAAAGLVEGEDVYFAA